MEQYRTTTTHSEDPYRQAAALRETGTGAAWFIIGGILVALAVLAYVGFSGSAELTPPAADTTTIPADGAVAPPAAGGSDGAVIIPADPAAPATGGTAGN